MAEETGELRQSLSSTAFPINITHGIACYWGGGGQFIAEPAVGDDSIGMRKVQLLYSAKASDTVKR
jgi:hypothetical protein